MSTPSVVMNPFIYNTLVASTFVIWDYCITFDDEVELIWRQKWSWVTIVFSIIRYVPIISTILVMANNIAPLSATPDGSCLAWMMAYLALTFILLFCLETLLIARVLALHENHRLLRYGLITFSVCSNVARIVILSMSETPGYTLEDGANISNVKCHVTLVPSKFPAAIIIVKIFPETVFFLLAFIKLIEARRIEYIPVSQLLVVIVRDGTWAYGLILAAFLWDILQFELAKKNKVIAFFWIVPIIGFTGTRLTLNLRSSAKTLPGGTSLENFDIKFATISAAESTHGAA